MTDKASKLKIKGLESEAVQHFLEEYPFLKPVLEEAEDRVPEFFGDEAELVYRLVHDPEIANWQNLGGYIWTGLTTDKAAERLREMDYEWFLNLPYEVRERLFFDIR